MNRLRTTLLAQGALLLMAAGGAQAHFALIQPASSLSTENGGKGVPPCGEGTDSNVVTQVQGGHSIAIQLTEFVFHPGHYRFALSVNSRAELPADPDVVQNNGISVSASIQNPVRIPVLADDVFDHDSPPTGDWQTSLTLPNLNCDKCTLQIIEFMAEHGFNPGGGFFYHHCADLKITADPALPPADPAWPRAVTQSRSSLPHIAVGGGWKTTLTLINTSPAAVPVTVTFHGDDGTALTLLTATTLQGVTQTSPTPFVNAIINPNATLLISTEDQLAATLTGWADIQSAGPLAGFATFRSTPATGPPSEGTVPLQTQSASTITVPYDNTGGASMGIALANLSTTSANIAVTMWDDSGNQLGTDTLTITGSGHTSFVLPSQLKLTAGKRGIVQFQSGASGGIAGFALLFRFSAFGSTFASVPTI